MTHYETLGLDSDASYADIKKAYREMASLHHPDRNGDAAKMSACNAAWKVLGDAEAKKRYDASGEDELHESIIESRAFEVLAGTFENLLMREFYKSGGLVAAAWEEVSMQKHQILTNLKESKEVTAKLKKRMASVRVIGGGLNMVNHLCEKRLAAIEDRSRQLREHLLVNKRALAMLEHYEDVPEPRKAGSGFIADRLFDSWLTNHLSTGAL